MEPESSPPRKRADEGDTISIIILILLVALGMYYVPKFLFLSHPRSHAPSIHMMNVHALVISLYAYAVDHGNAYPSGTSSTEVFQKLIDGGYVSDPSIFYFPMPGKTKATSNKLKPENVCWDVTASVKSDDAGELPLIFETGYRLHYVPGGEAIPLKPSGITIPGIYVGYKSNSVKFIKDDGLSDHIVPNVIDSMFSAKGKTYQQLTPDGILPP